MVVGTKITIVASSAVKSGAKIRKGSIGYIASVGKSYKLTDSFPSVIPARVIFTRYGNELKQRCEPKFIGIIIPTVSPDIIKNKQTYLDSLTKQAQDLSPNLNKIFLEEGVKQKKITTVVAVASNKSVDLMRDQNELTAWMTSILYSNMLHRVIYSNEKSPDGNLLKILQTDVPFAKSLIEKYMTDRSFFRKHVATFAEQEPIQCRQLISNIHTIRQLYMLKELSAIFGEHAKPITPLTPLVWNCWRLMLTKTVGIKLHAPQNKNIIALYTMISTWWNICNKLISQ